MCPSLMLTVLVPGLMFSGYAPSLMLAWSEIIIITKDGITKKKKHLVEMTGSSSLIYPDSKCL